MTLGQKIGAFLAHLKMKANKSSMIISKVM